MILYYGLLLAFIILMIVVMVFLGISSANPENKDTFRTQLKTIGLSTFFLIAVLGGLMAIYIESYPDYFRSYMLLMIHVNLFFSLLAVSVATLQQV
jgi:hypothetical protein